jgi:serine/threonine protein kinase
MGTVFLAEDTRHHRKVALKILPAETAAHADRLARFRREAQAVAALNHPHIVTIHSVEEAEGTQGRKADSDAALAALIAKYEKDAPYNIASAYGFQGEAYKTFEWLDKTVEYGDPGVSEIVSENLFAGIRSDPRWLPFLRKIGRAPEQLVRIEFKVTLPEDMAR